MLQVSVEDLTTTFSDQVADQSRPMNLVTPHKQGLHHFQPTSAATVRRLLASLNEGKATGSDGLPTMMLKTCSDALADLLTVIFNESLSEGCLPSAYKLAHVYPIHKKGDRTAACNYRPISLLPVSSKLLERIVLFQLQQYLRSTDGQSVLQPHQFAYRRHHSREDALSVCV